MIAKGVAICPGADIIFHPPFNKGDMSRLLDFVQGLGPDTGNNRFFEIS